MNEIEASMSLLETGLEDGNAVDGNHYIDEKSSEGTLYERTTKSHMKNEDIIGETLSDTPPLISKLKHPSIELGNRVLSLSQKGDWDACESTLNILQREAAVENLASPLANITDKVVKD